MSTKSNKLNTFGVFSSYTEEILVHKRYAKIHSVFPNGFNLDFGGELIYVSYHQKGMLSARGLTIDKNVFDLILPYLKTGLQVRYRSEQMVFYTRPHIFTIEFTDRIIKNLKVFPLGVRELESIYLKTHIGNMNLLKESGFSENPMLLNVLNSIQKTKEVTLNHINQLIGAGLGLTPTGDDFLQGLILMEKILAHPPYIQEMVQQQLLERSTTDVSLSYYEALFEGYGNKPLIRLFEAAKKKDDRKLKEALLLVQAYGETSGYDLLMGILTYLQIYKKMG